MLRATLDGWQAKAWAIAGIYTGLWTIMQILIGFHGAVLVVTAALAVGAVVFDFALWAHVWFRERRGPRAGS